MRAIMVMFDSLNRNYLSPYAETQTKTPNFQRLAQKTVKFNQCYAGSLPCMPARRELHTGRYNFLHRIWGPLEPFDDSMIQMLRYNGTYTHLISDHWHYWEEGGATYHTRYNSWEFVRGQEGDPCKGMVKDPEIPEHVFTKPGPMWRQDFVNRRYMQEEENHPLSKTMHLGMEFMKENQEQDNWFLQLECFDPHEPFFVPERFLRLYEQEGEYDGPMFDWIPYAKVTETEEQIKHVINKYSALVTMCDEYLGKILDLMDEYDMWKDTMLIVNTDHGLLLNDHGVWGKNSFPCYSEIANIPLFIWNPKLGVKGTCCEQLVQTIDIAPTLLHYFGLEKTADMDGMAVDCCMTEEKKVRDGALFGCFGLHVNYTDGRYVYMRAPRDDGEENLFNYTLLPLDMKKPFMPNYIKTMEYHDPLSFTKQMPVMRFKGHRWVAASLLVDSQGKPRPVDFSFMELKDMLFDLQSDPKQESPIASSILEQKLKDNMVALLKKSEAPPELYVRLEL